MYDTTSQKTSMDRTLTVASAIRIAWMIWLTLLVFPFLVLLCIVWKFANGEAAVRHDDHQTWFLVSALCLLAVVPLSFFWRAHLFKSYYSGNPLRPHNYLLGMLWVWVALEIGGLVSLFGCLIDRSLLPGLLPALVAFMFFVTFYPTGRCMTRGSGDSQDPEIYQTPR
jgi:hypothetical protein